MSLGSPVETPNVVLRAVLARVEELYRGDLVQRAVLHQRDSGGYQMIVVEQRDGAPAEGLATPSSAWAVVAREPGPVLLDVHTGAITPVDRPRNPLVHRGLPAAMSDRTVASFDARQVSHVLAFGVGSPCWGMVTIELAAPGQGAGVLATWRAHGAEVAREARDALGPLAPPPQAAEADALLPVVGRAMAPIVEFLKRVARFDDTVLLSGPTGVGKTQLAAWIHHNSPREPRPFVVVSLPNAPAGLVEAELFGALRGAYTGLTADRTGSIARADGGTVFLDEIDRAPVEVQDKLLRVLESREYQVLGDSKARTAHVRFIVGTNANLAEEVENGTFRRDLYWRISAMPVRIPPLAERADEIAGWAEFMLRRVHAQRHRVGEVRFGPGALELLERAPWPGNLRQLDAALRRAHLYAVADAGGHVVPAEAVRSSIGDAPSDDPLAGALRAGARQLLDAIDRGEATLEDARLLRAFTLLLAVTESGEAAGMTRLGMARQLVGRNHKATIRGERRLVEAFLARR